MSSDPETASTIVSSPRGSFLHTEEEAPRTRGLTTAAISVERRMASFANRLAFRRENSSRRRSRGMSSTSKDSDAPVR